MSELAGKEWVRIRVQAEELAIGEIERSGEKVVEAPEVQSQSCEFRLERCIEAREQGGYLEVKFPVPERTERIEVSYTVQTQDKGQSVIDLGVRDEARMRGWSGGARTGFAIGLHRATPGYIAGAIAPGEWAVVLGTHRVAPEGCTVQIDVRLQIAKPRWLCGDLHLHTEHSDGVFTVEETIQLARRAGLDFIALTDHNAVSQNESSGWRDGLLLIPGMELTTGRGHCNLYGVADPLRDFRAVTADQLKERLAEARAAGAYISLNHPHDAACGWHWGFDVDHDWVEIWNGSWSGANARTLAWWQDQLTAGRRITAIAGSDTHRPHPYVRHGWPTAWVFAEGNSAEQILKAVDQGRVTLSYAPDGPFVVISCGGVMMGGEWKESRDGKMDGEIGGELDEELDRVQDEVPYRKLNEELGGDMGVKQDEEMHVNAKLNGGQPVLRLQMKRLAAGDEVRLWSDRGQEYAITAEADGEMDLERELPLRRFWRAEVWRAMEEAGGQKRLVAATNPVYFG
ncbi:CehA/McbA family metallohydrolase [Paenibacillus tepidiphilus]|uniref:CehA/McbA family metallohydrolase n=1 Tax=Paenibacillus tepidiphilus TaxID=2608683 RepID=UPI001239E604|nr:CehA/McbA family metallohydrolase [Paenibacillus tepidiphilus]